MGDCTYVGGKLVTWCSQRQYVISNSSIEVNNQFMAKIACEMIWLHSLVERKPWR